MTNTSNEFENENTMGQNQNMAELHNENSTELDDENISEIDILNAKVIEENTMKHQNLESNCPPIAEDVRLIKIKELEKDLSTANRLNVALTKKLQFKNKIQTNPAKPSTSQQNCPSTSVEKNKESKETTPLEEDHKDDNLNSIDNVRSPHYMRAGQKISKNNFYFQHGKRGGGRGVGPDGGSGRRGFGPYGGRGGYGFKPHGRRGERDFKPHDGRGFRPHGERYGGRNNEFGPNGGRGGYGVRPHGRRGERDFEPHDGRGFRPHGERYSGRNNECYTKTQNFYFS